MAFPTAAGYLIGAACLVLDTSAAIAASLPRSVSTSRQFIVFGGDAIVRGAVSDVAERVKSNLLRLLQASDGWSVPIVLSLQMPQANLPEIPRAALNFSQTGAGLKIQLDLLIERDFAAATLEREVLRALLLEMSYRATPSLPAGQPYVAPPDWMVDGILTLNNESPAILDALDRVSAHPIPLADFLSQKPGLLDSPSRLLYRAYASTLLRTLIGGENGRAQLQRFITALPRATNDPVADLREHFPSLGATGEDMERNWKACVTRVATEQQFALINFNVTSDQLDELLHTKVAQDRTGTRFLTITQAVRATHPKIDVNAARELGQRLMLLAAHAHPLLQTIVFDYQQAAELLAKNKTRDLRQRFAASAALRERVSSRMRRVDDFMNWFEATQAPTSSGGFRDYLHAAESAAFTPRRGDPLSVYLDAMETQFQ